MAELTDYLKQVLADKAEKTRSPVKKPINRSVNARPHSANVQNPDVRSPKTQNPAARHQDLRHSDLHDTGIQNMGAENPQNTDLRNADIQHTDIQRTDIQHTDIRNTDIQRTDTRKYVSQAVPDCKEPVVSRDVTGNKTENDEKEASGLIGYLQRAVADKASDLFIVAGGRVSEKVDKVLLPISQENVMPAEAERLITEFYTRAKRSMDGYIERGDDDFSLSIPGLARFRINTYRQRGSMAAVVRVVIFDIPDWRSLHIPAQVIGLAAATHGMVLVTGTAGSGKSTTQACIIDQINKTRGCHIITLEDPIEYLHRNRKSIVSQREIAIDSENYLTALRACLRQSPDVISLGEMRDHETIRTAMTAAETGHLLITTLHTQGAVNTIDRIIDSFPSSQQAQVRVQLSMVLHTVVSQQLLPGVNGELIPAYEIMCMNNAIRSLIRESKSHQIDNVIAAGSAEGMISMDQSILRLYQERKIAKETALEYADHPDQLRRRMAE